MAWSASNYAAPGCKWPSTSESIEWDSTVDATVLHEHPGMFGVMCFGHSGGVQRTTGRFMRLAAGFTLIFVPGFGRRVYSKSVEITTSPIRCPVAKT